MRVADTSSTDDGFTILESGQKLHHHTKSTCEAPCALHSPIDGPWAEWPRLYWPGRGCIYRVCPHNMAHPAVEQAIYLIKHGEGEKLAHKCCNECMCLPRATLPDSLFNGDFIPVPLTLLNWAHWTEPKEQESEPESEQNNENRDPNLWAGHYLDINLRLSNVPLDFFNLLRTDMLDQMDGHYIIEVTGFNDDSRYSLECVDHCSLTLQKDGKGKWFNNGKSWCPVVEIALLAGWEPQNWNDGDDGDDEEDD